MIKSLASTSVDLVKQSVEKVDVQQVMAQSSHLARVSVHYIQEEAPKLASKAVDYVSEHPYQTGFHAASTALLLSPGSASVPMLGGMGFGAKGVVGGMPNLLPLE